MSLPGQSLGLTGSFGEMQATPANRPQVSSDLLMRPPHKETPIFNWFYEEKPWDPIGIQGVNPTIARQGSKAGYRPSGSAFANYRGSQAPPSECETSGLGPILSDSGYDSVRHSRHSVVGGESIYGDYERSTETVSVSNGLAGLQFEHQPTPSPEDWKPQGPIRIDAAVNSDSSRDLVCQYCNKHVRTRSELKYVFSLLRPLLLWAALADFVRTKESIIRSTTNLFGAQLRAAPVSKASAPRTMSTDT